MLIEDVGKLLPMDQLIHWISERHRVYLRRKAKKPKPWTEDTIIQSTFFTNPYRENDKVTVWVRENIRKTMENSPSLVFAVVCFRWFNWIPTGKILRDTGLLEQWDTKLAVGTLTEYRDSGYQVFTGAFNISNSGVSKPKVNRVCEDYLQPVWADLSSLLEDAARWQTLGEAHKRLMQYPGLGGSGFMAAQVVCDLKYTPILERATDWWTWCSPGPGSKRGLNVLLGKDPEAPVPKNWTEEVNRLREMLVEKLPEMPPFHAQDVQNCLCEYSKYMRCLQGDGHSKRRYAGT